MPTYPRSRSGVYAPSLLSSHGFWMSVKSENNKNTKSQRGNARLKIKAFSLLWQTFES